MHLDHIYLHKIEAGGHMLGASALMKHEICKQYNTSWHSNNHETMYLCVS